jgi:type I restriction enzyme S subunit
MAIQSFATVSAGGTPSRANPSYWGGDIPWITTAHVNFNTITGAEEFITRRGLEQSAAKLETPNTLLIALYGQGPTRGRVAILGIEAATNQACAAIVVKSEVSPRFLFYYLAEHYEKIRAISNKGNQTNLNGKLVKTIAVVVPPRSEQNAIAGALSDVDGLIEALEKLIAKKQSIKQAVMQQLLTGKTRLPKFSGRWETKRIGDITTCLPTANNPRADLSEYGEVEYIHYGDVHAYAQPVLHCAYASLPRIDKNRVGSATQLQNGDLVMVDASEDLAGLGKSVEVQTIMDRIIVAGLHTILCRSNSDQWAVGFKAYLQFMPAFKADLMRVASGISVYAISKKQLADIEIALPSPSEQEIIVAVLSDLDAEIATFERQLCKAKQIKQGMLQQLLTGRIRLVKRHVSIEETDALSKRLSGHNKQFDDAVLISVLARQFGTEQYPLGRKRYTKLSYLLKRHAKRPVDEYLKKAAGPYNPKTKYGGPERIAVESGYIREHTSGPYRGFVAADNIAQAESYFEKWYPDGVKWLAQFRLRRNDDLEVLTTVDMAALELRAAGKNVDVAGVKDVIRSHPEWQAKLDRPVFSDINIGNSLKTTRTLFG